MLKASTMKSRKGYAIQRVMNAMRQTHADSWFIVVDTLTLADDRLEAFYDNPNTVCDCCLESGRLVLAAEGRRANDSHADCFFFFQAEDGIRDVAVTGVQTCALPISRAITTSMPWKPSRRRRRCRAPSGSRH